MARLLLHVCCGPCSTRVIDELSKTHELTAYFYNPNVYPHAEYAKRLESARLAAEQLKVSFLAGDYDCIQWEKCIVGHEADPEGGARCELCYEFRLRNAAEKARGYDMFATTLSISPHKDPEKINASGKKVESSTGVNFLSADFRQGFRKSVEMSKEFGIYRQDYCGCRFSLRSNIASPKL